MTNYFDDIVIPLLICISKFLQLESCFQIEDENVTPEKPIIQAINLNLTNMKI